MLPDLTPEYQSGLSDLQAQVDIKSDRRARYEVAKRLFSNKRGRIFFEIKLKLANASPPGQACFYCERDRYRDIDHVKPKRHYPEQCFVWTNYVYACTICNQDGKGDRYAVIQDNGLLVEFDRTWPEHLPLPDGIHAFLDIRSEDPLDHLILDLLTGQFVPMAPSGVSRQRAIFTRDLLKLDSDNLSRLRRQAVNAYTDYLLRYSEAQVAGLPEKAKRILNEILELPQPTVLVEMLRQRGTTALLQTLVNSLPDDFPLWSYVSEAVVACARV